ncbi:B12-binding domain-containing radical SAM protein [Candidatus Omnitrophota bacterium]
MNVLLINPPYRNLFKRISGASWLTPPLGLAYLAAVLEQIGDKLRIEDLDMIDHPEGYAEHLQGVLQEFNPELVGITSTTPNIYQAQRIAKLVKQFNREIKVVLGGPHPSALPEEVLASEFVDFVVKGEGELALTKLSQKLNTPGHDFSEIRGLYYKQDGKIIQNGPCEYVQDLNALPDPARHLLDFTQYTHPLMKEKVAATILTGRGCPYQCTFCNKKIFGTTVRLRSIDSVIAEIIAINQKYNIREFHIIDDIFNINVERVVEFCHKIIALNKKFIFALPNGIRADMLFEDTAKLMKKAGFYSVSFGLESANEKTLIKIRKRLDLKQVEQAFRIARRAGLETVAFIIVGFPNESEEDLNNTLRFLRKIKPDVVDFQTLIPLPGTEIYDELKANNQIVETDWSKYTFHDQPVFFSEHLSRERIAVLYRKAYVRYHIHPLTIWLRLKKIRSVRDVMINLKGLKTIVIDTWLKK